MSEVGYVTKVAVDPDEHNGNDQAAAIVTRVHEDGTYNLRVFSDDALVSDEFRSHVDLDGGQHDYEAAAQTSGSDAPVDAPPAAAATTEPAAPAGTPPVAQQGAGY